MFNLQPVPEIGLGSKSICDICMRKQSSEYFNCGFHKMCDNCFRRFSHHDNCPLCGKCNQRCVEKLYGRLVVVPNTYNPNDVYVYDVSTSEDNEIGSRYQSEDVGISSLSTDSNDSESDSLDDDMQLETDSPALSSLSSNEDVFACLDTAYDQQQQSAAETTCQLSRSAFSMYKQEIPCFSNPYIPSSDKRNNLSDENCPIDTVSTAFVSFDFSPSYGFDRPESTDSIVGKKRRTLQKSKNMNTDDFKRMIELCNEL